MIPVATVTDGSFVFGVCATKGGQLQVCWRTRRAGSWFPCGYLRPEGSGYAVLDYEGNRVGAARDVESGIIAVRDYNQARVPGLQGWSGVALPRGTADQAAPERAFPGP